MHASEHQERENQKDPAVHKHPFVFFFFGDVVSSPPRGRGKHKPGTRLELIGHSAILSDTKGDACPKRHQTKSKSDLHVWAQNDNE